MRAGYELQDGGRVDVESIKDKRRVSVEVCRDRQNVVVLSFTLSEARAISSALMGAAAEA